MLFHHDKLQLQEDGLGHDARDRMIVFLLTLLLQEENCIERYSHGAPIRILVKGAKLEKIHFLSD